MGWYGEAFTTDYVKVWGGVEEGGEGAGEEGGVQGGGARKRLFGEIHCCQDIFNLGYYSLILKVLVAQHNCVPKKELFDENKKYNSENTI